MGARPADSRWQFSADREGRESLIALLEILAVAPPGSSRTIPTTHPSGRMLGVLRTPHDGHDIAHRLRLGNDEDPDRWSLQGEAGDVTWRLGARQQLSVLKALHAMRKGEGDFSIGPDDRRECVMFWWWLDT